MNVGQSTRCNNVFVDNKYSSWYYAIINNRIASNDRLTYGEKHHILPKSLGGVDVDNIIKLSAREHFVCHWLLTKMTTGAAKKKMTHALWMMSTKRLTKRSSIFYERRKLEKSALMKGNRIASGKHSQARVESNRQAQLKAQNEPALKARLRKIRSSKEFGQRISTILKAVFQDPKIKEKIAQKKRKPVDQLTLNLDLVTRFSSAKEAEERTGISRSHISSCIHGKRKHAGGFVWKFTSIEGQA